MTRGLKPTNFDVVVFRLYVDTGNHYSIVPHSYPPRPPLNPGKVFMVKVGCALGCLEGSRITCVLDISWLTRRYHLVAEMGISSLSYTVI